MKKNNWNCGGFIQKFSNGNINLKADVKEFTNIDAFYESMTNNDLYFNQINGYMYLVDFNTSHVYDFSDCYINILAHLENLLYQGYDFKTNPKTKTLKLYPLTKKESKSLLQDLENGF
jgi:hypothetical protein